MRKGEKMKTVTTTKIETRIDSLQFGYWDMEDEEFVPFSSMVEEKLDEAAKLLGCTPLLLDALAMLTESICESVAADLADIWERLEEAGV